MRARQLSMNGGGSWCRSRSPSREKRRRVERSTRARTLRPEVLTAADVRRVADEQETNPVAALGAGRERLASNARNLVSIGMFTVVEHGVDSRLLHSVSRLERFGHARSFLDCKCAPKAAVAGECAFPSPDRDAEVSRAAHSSRERPHRAGTPSTRNSAQWVASDVGASAAAVRPRGPKGAAQEMTRTFSACGPFGPCLTSNSTFCPSASDLKPVA